MFRFRSSLRYKTGAWMLLLSLGPLIAVGVIVLTVMMTQLSHFSTRLREAEDSLSSGVVGRTLKGAAADTASEIDHYLLQRIIDVRRWSEDRDVIEAARLGTQAAQQSGLAGLSPDAVQARLPDRLFIPISSTVYAVASAFVFRQIERPQTPLVEILVTEASGINVLITRPLPRITHADAAWWQAARGRGIAGIGVDEVYRDPATNEPAIGLALPIIDPNTKETLGVMRALFKLDDLQRRLSQKALSVDADIRVFTRDGRLLG